MRSGSAGSRRGQDMKKIVHWIGFWILQHAVKYCYKSHRVLCHIAWDSEFASWRMKKRIKAYSIFLHGIHKIILPVGFLCNRLGDRINFKWRMLLVNTFNDAGLYFGPTAIRHGHGCDYRFLFNKPKYLLTIPLGSDPI